MALIYTFRSRFGLEPEATPTSLGRGSGVGVGRRVVPRSTSTGSGVGSIVALVGRHLARLKSFYLRFDLYELSFGLLCSTPKGSTSNAGLMSKDKIPTGSGLGESLSTTSTCGSPTMTLGGIAVDVPAMF
ncbi:hypothetical protein Salat_0189700 [Sesamum alatum]|uniref:Uncharacterized protein n=1 Tax=Sesamum alatum TaxID=300844 RepID=A0AAE1YYE8_9LAMI|nr:hypothetical protein Salat_0189700 [Sesamum alatum]